MPQMREAIRSRLVAYVVARGFSEATAWAWAEAHLDEALRHAEQVAKAVEDDERDEAGGAAGRPQHTRVREFLSTLYALRALDDWLARKP